MIILSLDTATKTGWCLLKDGRILESGVQDFSKKRGESNGAMFLRFRVWLNNMFFAYAINFVSYEQAHHRGGAATEICINLTGRVQETCADRGVEYAAIHTGILKKWATGSGKGDKQAMMNKAKGFLGREAIDDNEADAVLMAVYTYEEYGAKNRAEKADALIELLRKNG